MTESIKGARLELFLECLRAPDVRNVLLKSGAEPLGNSPEEFAQALRREIPKWGKIIQAAGIKPE